ncbi:hypothetical protein [Levilactobacillus wangkuiensis]|uniref:hypothetical protein n=1 Tax=Levilactobacillus wangkuiensis TaxID=2799566 RepID=UPI0019512498|nr:hypothetical protein [Levilactobacillus wangkuiensis]
MYEKQECTPISKGETLNRAYYDSEWVGNWQDIYIKKVKVSEKYDIKTNALKPRLQINSDVEHGIKKLKVVMAEQLGARNVTIGAVIRMVLKAGLIRNGDHDEEDVSQIFSSYRKEVAEEVTEEQWKKILLILERMEIDVKQLLI